MSALARDGLPVGDGRPPRDGLASGCPVCGADGGEQVHLVPAVPVNSCLLVDTAQEARSLPTARLELVTCSRCGHLANRAFDERLARYTDRYEDSQAFSPTFMEYASDLADQWVSTWDLRGRTVVEIGAGRGDFSRLLVEAGAGRVVAMDPTIRADRAGDDEGGRIAWLAEQFDDPSDLPDCDAVVFRHVLEHVGDPRRLLEALSAALRSRPEVPVLVEVPDVRRVLTEGAFWDVYYEHCAYFVPDTLEALFTSCGLVVRDITSVFAGQYLLVAATAAAGGIASDALPPPDRVEALHVLAAGFREQVAVEVERWRRELAERQARHQDVVLWGAGSKATAFLTLTSPGRCVSRVVDVNPYKQGRFVLGSGLPIVAPEELRDRPCDVVVVMNPVYLREIREQLAAMGVSAEVLTLGATVADVAGHGS